MSADISLKTVRIATPCPVRWVDMHGDDRVRYCQQCRLNVYNLSAMTHGEAVTLVQEKEGRLCVSYYQRADGTIITKDCPVGIRLAHRALARLTGLAAVICLGLLQLIAFASNAAGVRYGSSLREVKPFSWLNRAAQTAPPLGRMIAGEVSLPLPKLPAGGPQ